MSKGLDIIRGLYSSLFFFGALGIPSPPIPPPSMTTLLALTSFLKERKQQAVFLFLHRLQNKAYVAHHRYNKVFFEEVSHYITFRSLQPSINA
ncbi:hypothetical protein NPIL_634721 [Nephila pilipes]|uniref:Uncharacterized protein n=1 Tax=Nephila pilipes TaxID=299642 RepID=A0A8X6SZR2_NEPPI|nr:hypothetical protein NPIL_634721 [Nephila pilipes]